MAKEPLKTPEELRRDHLAQQAVQDRLRGLRQKAFRERWMAISAAIGVVVCFPNYLALDWTCIPHALLCGAMGWLIVVFRRGHLSSMGIVGLGNLLLSLLLGHFNPIGVLAFILAGGVIGLGVAIERDI